MALDKKDQEKTAFACHVGLVNFQVMLFWLSNADVYNVKWYGRFCNGLPG